MPALVWLENTMKKSNKKLSNTRAHQKLIEFFVNSYFEDEEKSGSKLKKLRNYRNNSDYDENFRENNVRKSEKITQELFNLFDKLKKNNPHN